MGSVLGSACAVTANPTIAHIAALIDKAKGAGRRFGGANSEGWAVGKWGDGIGTAVVAAGWGSGCQVLGKQQPHALGCVWRCNSRWN
ncbi:hypothetical protein Zmor_005515 [Zophobas morio]|uniref:Uncharacterized protein n=1 Tax=Zophobas morio TaxID=2755281 RepID=A0AA38IUN3_9CUCU|nr:hypothetical protein Zmor_005515 [Zophobas morio]